MPPTHILLEKSERNWAKGLECTSSLSFTLSRNHYFFFVATYCFRIWYANRALRLYRRYQSVTNWFQNQRSFAKRRKEEEPVSSNYSSPLPIRADSIEHLPHPTLPRAVHLTPLSHHSSSIGPSPTRSDLFLEDHHQHQPVGGDRDDYLDQKALSLRRLGMPIPRTRRARPEPYQLEALRKLFSQTPNPSIEERGALAQEIGM